MKIGHINEADAHPYTPKMLAGPLRRKQFQDVIVIVVLSSLISENRWPKKCPPARPNYLDLSSINFYIGNIRYLFLESIIFSLLRL